MREFACLMLVCGLFLAAQPLFAESTPGKQRKNEATDKNTEAAGRDSKIVRPLPELTRERRDELHQELIDAISTQDVAKAREALRGGAGLEPNHLILAVQTHSEPMTELLLDHAVWLLEALKGVGQINDPFVKLRMRDIADRFSTTQQICWREAKKSGIVSLVKIVQSKSLNGYHATFDLEDLMVAAQEGRTGLLKHILTQLPPQSAAQAAASLEWQLAVERAAGSGHTEALRALVDSGIAIDPKIQMSAVLRASRSGHEGTLRLLLEKATSIDSNTLFKALTLARFEKHTAVVSLLESQPGVTARLCVGARCSALGLRCAAGLSEFLSKRGWPNPIGNLME